MQNKQPIAILMATYNGEKFLAQQIDSLLNQTYQNWTLYIRDDGSTDSSQTMIRNYCSRYPNIIFIEDSDGNLGCRNNFFRLLEVVESKYYMFCDEDDEWLPNKIEITMQRMQQVEAQYPNRPIAVHTDSALCDASLNIIARSYWQNARFNPENFFTYNQLGVNACVEGATMMINHLAKQASFPIAPNSSMYDAWIALHVLKAHGIISSIHTSTRLYRQHNNNVYGIPLKISLLEKIRKSWRITLLNAKYLKNAGWGGYAKYAWFWTYVRIKKFILRIRYKLDNNIK